MDQALSTSLEGLAKRIRREQGAVEAALTGVAAHAMAAGDLLLEAKKKVPHGDWLTWLALHCELGETTAQSYMRLAKNRAKIEANPQRVEDLSLRRALALIAPVPPKESAVVEFVPPDRLAERDAAIARGQSFLDGVDLDDPELIDRGRDRELLGLDKRGTAGTSADSPSAPRGMRAMIAAALPMFGLSKPAAEPPPLSPAAAEAKAFRNFMRWAIEVCRDLGETPEETAESLGEVAGWLRQCSDPRKWADDLAALGNEAAEAGKRKAEAG